MSTLLAINIAELYQRHLQQSGNHSPSPQKWDNKAQKMAQHLIEKRSHYTETLLSAINARPDETVLDIGCGPGTLALPLAQQCKQVYALDYSKGMLEVLTQYQQRLNLDNITPLHCSWEQDWQNVPQADIVVASRSTMVQNLDDAIDKITAKARKRVYLTAITQPSFLDADIFAALNRQPQGFPTYIYWLNRLYQRGIQAELRFINADLSNYQGDYVEFLKSVEFTLGSLNDEEKQCLENFYNERKIKQIPIKHGQPKWALIWWRC
ncbi:class I SAM-dependent methyltransferase [Gallibacterium anatis]|uniref:Methyltransferase domain-containing protein n=1 Tax=Gallibacterium anatis TaxID=750 RepID=A0A0A2XHD7_9PAST|nr:class I SAM-dependent methyltransferase [Gallibacterium anatis]KGQ31568.1 hypothetical protein JP32_06560 [Gallibacterium anatis]